jgi:putative salt-induced outer membrane protein YdiY
MRFVRSCSVALILLHPRLALAQAPAPPPRHEETFEAAYVGVSGNASSNTFGLGADVTARPDSWVIRNKASFVRNESAGVLLAKAIDYTGRVQKTLSPRAATFGEYAFFRDRFAGIATRNGFTAGFSLKAVATATQTLTLDLGAGYLNERRLSGANISSGSYMVGTAYKATMSPTAELTEDFHVTGIARDSGNWRLEQTIAVTTRLAAGFSLKVSNGIRHANLPPPGFKKTDSVTSVALVAKFAHPQ